MSSCPTSPTASSSSSRPRSPGVIRWSESWGAAAWESSISPVRCGSIGRWRSSCCPPTTLATRTCGSDSCGKRAPPRSSATPTLSRFSRWTKSAPSCSSSWRTSPARRSPSGCADGGRSRPPKRDACCGKSRGPWHTHSQGLVHRDVKPDNIMLEEASGRALVADFGIAGLVRGAAGLDGGEVIGTPEFMSPEQALGEGVDARSDLYALGVVGYFAVSGTLPFEAGKATEVLAKQITEPAPKLGDLLDRKSTRLNSS